MPAFPNIPFSDVSLTSNTPTIVTKSLNGKEQRTQVGGQYFSFTGRFGNLTEAERKQLQGFIASVRGNLTSFTVTFPTNTNIGNSTGTYSGTITAVTAAAGAVQFTGTVGTSGAAVFKAGDLIKFSSHDKVYTVTADATATGTSLANVQITPPLRTAVSSGTVTHKSVPITVRFSEDAIGFSTDPTYYSSFDLSFTEVL
jgi:hypothetical protein